MNWHSIGRFIQKHLKDGIVIDFGSTTTDFICIKDWQIKNNWFDDFYRINNAELMYTGVTRTPIFAICNSVKYNAKTFNIIPELFSTLSDVYRINGKINKEFDIDEETDSSHKNSESSYRRLARSFSLDYKKKDTKFIQGLSKKIMNNQLQKISDNIKFLQKKFSINRNSPVILSGIGQDILSVYLKNYKTILFKEFIENKNCNLSKIASYHAPATCIAHLLEL